MRVHRFGETFIICLVLSGCASGPSSVMTESWVNPRLPRPPALEKALVVAFARSEEMRMMYEDEMVRQLASRGTEATPSYRVVPAPAADKFPDADALERAAKDASIPYLITSRLVNIKAKPGSERTRQVSWSDLYDKATEETRTVPAEGTAVIESYVYDVATRDAVWSGTTETELPAANRQEVASELIRILLKQMAELRMVKVIN